MRSRQPSSLTILAPSSFTAAISSSGMGHFSRTSDTAPSDEAIQNECKYYEVDQVVFEEKLVPRDTASGRHVSSSRSRRHEKPGTDVDSTDDEPARPLRERSSSHSPTRRYKSCGRKLSRSPPCDSLDCGLTASTRSRKSNKKISRKSRHHSLHVEVNIPGFHSSSSRKRKQSASRLKEREFSPDGRYRSPPLSRKSRHDQSSRHQSRK